MSRQAVHFCKVCGLPVYGGETVCPPCLPKLNRILHGADPRQSDHEDEFIFSVESDPEGWTSYEESWQASATA
jgi:hypothetical protein